MSRTKVVFVGDACTGKTLVRRWIKRGEMPTDGKYVPTLGVENEVPVDGSMNIWDTSGSHIGLADGYYIQGDIFVVFNTDARPCPLWMRRGIARQAPRAHVINVCVTSLNEGREIPGYLSITDSIESLLVAIESHA